MVILLALILGILGSYGVSWFGIRINTVANSHGAFFALGESPGASALRICGGIFTRIADIGRDLVIRFRSSILRSTPDHHVCP